MLKSQPVERTMGVVCATQHRADDIELPGAQRRECCLLAAAAAHTQGCVCGVPLTNGRALGARSTINGQLT